MTELWPSCGDQEPGTLGSCVLRRGHPGVHRSESGSWGDDARRLEDAAQREADDAASHARIRAAVEGIYTDYVGNEGRGGATGVRDAVLRILEKEWPGVA